MSKMDVYNLEFPENISELNIGGYIFTRVKEYEQRFLGLQHTFAISGGEFSHEVNIGTHQITATVEIPKQEDDSILPWESAKKVTKLQDVLFLLTLFTERNVFICDDNILPISADSRCHFRGGSTGEFRSFINHEYKYKNRQTGDIADSMSGKKIDYCNVDLGFEKTVNSVLELTRSDDWQKTFSKGYFLFLFREMMDQIYITSAFLICWTICEHLFALHNSNWLDKNEIRKVSGESKISYIYQKYTPNYFAVKSSNELKKIVETRNRLVHYGKIPDNTDLNEMKIFTIITQEVIAIILGLRKIEKGV